MTKPSLWCDACGHSLRMHGDRGCAVLDLRGHCRCRIAPKEPTS